MNSLKDLFLLDPEIVFLNHGSFGATPRPVFEAFQRWQRDLERQPVRFLLRELPARLASARAELAAFLGADADDLVFVPNATYGVNAVARSLRLGPDDEVLTSDHEYGACDRIWTFHSERHGFRLVRAPLPLPAASAEDLVERLWTAVTPRTRVVFLSHLTSPTALILPLEELCRRARAAGILTVIDGAHAPGQLDLDLRALGADLYTGNAHKWLLAPKSAGFLYARPEVQHLIDPLVVSWGWRPDPPYRRGSSFQEAFEWLGTGDFAAYLSVPAALRFQAEHGWPAVRERCHALLRELVARLAALTGLPPIYPDDGFYRQMAAVPLPSSVDADALAQRLYRDHRIEVPVTRHGERKLLRVSLQGYNTAEDADALAGALERLL